jgi:hypothetical protein
MQVTAGVVNLDITNAQATAGVDQMVVSDNSTQLLWGTNNSSQKITAVSNLAAPLYTMQLEATSATQGSSAGPMTLTSTAGDLVTNIGRTSGSCTLRYTAFVLASQGIGSESHLVILTVQTQ